MRYYPKIQVSQEAHRKIKILSAETGKKIPEVMDDIITRANREDKRMGRDIDRYI